MRRYWFKARKKLLDLDPNLDFASLKQVPEALQALAATSRKWNRQINGCAGYAISGVHLSMQVKPGGQLLRTARTRHQGCNKMKCYTPATSSVLTTQAVDL